MSMKNPLTPTEIETATFRLVARHLTVLPRSPYICRGKDKGKVHPRTSLEGPEGEYRYSSIHSLTSTVDGGWVVNATTRPLNLR